MTLPEVMVARTDKQLDTLATLRDQATGGILARFLKALSETVAHVAIR
jgi:hypothetical protein